MLFKQVQMMGIHRLLRQDPNNLLIKKLVCPISPHYSIIMNLDHKTCLNRENIE